MLQIDAPPIVFQYVPFNHPVKGLPCFTLGTEITNRGDSRTVISDADILSQQSVTGRPEHEHDAGMMTIRKMWRIVKSICQTIE